MANLKSYRALFICIIFLMTQILSFAQDPKAAQTASDGSAGHQWTVFAVSPENALLTVDGQTYQVRGGLLQLMLGPGMHQYVCVSPFYETRSGEFELKDDERENVRIILQPTFAFISVTSYDRKAQIYIDGRPMGTWTAESGRLTPGPHGVMLVKGETCLYSTTVILEKGEKKALNLGLADFNPRPLAEVLAFAGLSMADFLNQGSDENGMAAGTGSLNVHTNVPGATVLVNGLERGTTPCIVKDIHAGGPYRVTVRLKGCKDVTKMVRIKDGEMTELGIKLKKIK